MTTSPSPDPATADPAWLEPFGAPMTKLEDKIADTLDQEHIDEAAAWTAEQLLTVGYAKVELTPGDMTVYPILIARPGPVWGRRGEGHGRYYWVVLCADFGAGYEWHGGRIDGYYAAQKWTNHGVSKGVQAWTAEVMARFLTATSKALSAPIAIVPEPAEGASA